MGRKLHLHASIKALVPHTPFFCHKISDELHHIYIVLQQNLIAVQKNAKNHTFFIIQHCLKGFNSKVLNTSDLQISNPLVLHIILGTPNATGALFSIDNEFLYNLMVRDCNCCEIYPEAKNHIMDAKDGAVQV